MKTHLNLINNEQVQVEQCEAFSGKALGVILSIIIAKLFYHSSSYVTIKPAVTSKRSFANVIKSRITACTVNDLKKKTKFRVIIKEKLLEDSQVNS